MSKKKRSQNEAKAMPKQGLKAYQPTKALLDLKTRRENEKKPCTLDSTWRSLPLQQHQQRHPAAAPCNSTSNPAAKRKHATLPRLEVYNNPNSFAIWGKKNIHEEKSQLWN
jgi:hypothetical protein